MPKHAERLTKIIEAFPNVTVTVLGDLVADEFVFGEIARVSREAPVLILRHREREVVPGGAANAIYNLADLGVSVLPVGVVGDDEPGRLLLQRFRHKRIPLSGIQKIKGHTTVTKTRILAGFPHSARQQVVRIDQEPQMSPGGSIVRKLVSSARQYARASDALLVSDYGYGAATPEILFNVRSAATDIAVTVDSRHRLLEYNGVTAATPNEPEVEEALGVRIGHDTAQLEAAGKLLLRRMALQALVVTRGRDGMTVFPRGHKSVNIPIHGTDQVADVTGAGDTVIAAFTAALAGGGDAEEAARIANIAGGIVVTKRGTATVTAGELLHAVQHG
ncbi:MAG: bifunctional hydroxymethylpyrimidine kinase/phosphomethylpyrimidine kinase [Candidatus Koribacter versatilis]|uniref:Bifunctional hydroxymethylpyrimidine kinase/phosphomethylpyrimidine kinase n=1 Tax=Candidatus Korobacter versatilis TaxID=658062 RepID=A0A932A7Y3_9BACT|nr:bifunctional hydroxymethylpyrimidine kinase/phosphomethylpyrimidine kinase [Candidatus Koribacter versatilis]